MNQVSSSEFVQNIKNDYSIYCKSKQIIEGNEEKLKAFYLINSISCWICEKDELNLYEAFEYFYFRLILFSIKFEKENFSLPHTSSRINGGGGHATKIQKKDEQKNVKSPTASKLKFNPKKQGKLSFGITGPN